MQTQLSENSLVQKRQVIYASLIRYAPEAASLRQRVLDRLVLGSLIGSNQDSPYRIGQIRANLLFAPSISRIRVEVIQESLRRLLSEEKVKSTESKKRAAYYLTESAAKELEGLVDSGEDLFNPVLRRSLENTSHLFPSKVGSSIFRTFLCECFSRFGAEIARTVTGELVGADLIQSADVEAAFEAATLQSDLSPDATESLKARCYEFLKSQDPNDVRLKFHLTQGFYFAQLLGLPGTSFNPLGEQAFANSVLYLDTNVLIVGLLAPDAGTELFKEMVTISRKIGTTLRVTRATINETRRVAADRVSVLHKLLEALPAEIIGRASDQFITAFLEARELDPTLVPEVFLSPFEHLSEVLSSTWGIEIDEKIEDEMLKGVDFLQVANVLQESTLHFRKFEKSEMILRHDVSHYALVSCERATNPQTWFLTRDRSLAHAALKLRKEGEQPFCFSLLGFLQAISPFMKSDESEERFADVFSDLMQEPALSGEILFSAKELVLLLEMHRDVLSTPQTSLLPALDYVKTVVLRGEPYKMEDCAKVALGLRTYLASSGDERRRELEEQKAAAEKQAIQARSVAAAEQDRRKILEADMSARNAEISELAETNEGMAREIEFAQRRDERSRLVIAIIGIGAAAIWWSSANLLWAKLVHMLPQVETRESLGRFGLGVIGVLLFFVPGLSFVNSTRWNYKVKCSAVTALAVAALASSRLLDRTTWASFWVGILEAIGIAVPLLISRVPHEGSRDDQM